ncbi:Pectate lyase superfamily protein [uncultured Caudovirales phage]|uniref:Pectate lyase superfamily protein n=1 Tax=uncultured Caudovirales phage TaxID=2100421 RepID=A0A6J5SYX7_9CAUD|nr:Pectate lyase superfamily protein [uncultured Caudovirales phage]CAB4165597.1 Pectate lyase superfamily protein [uncultured Caudovirales phage]CAB4186752.1 Pectate lyase superfamily protein [uncultured Caudovirales phage]CAB4220713.1 Pectate lyase superfamily protein [uncultured Caudovirales phage]
MAIVSISRITQRKGTAENLPQLSGAELGWSIDTRQLYIGNGTLAEGAPVVGNTEILTEFSDILGFNTTYTYQGAAAGYTVQTGPTAGNPVTQSLQTWLDQWASVKDFGAAGDGVTDDTDAINRALYQLYCREVNPAIRRSLFFPAGVYLVSQSIIIPTWATLYGEGVSNSRIQLNSGDDSALRAYVARTGDSKQQTGANIGSNSATPPQGITISNMAFESLDPDADIFLVEDAVNCSFQNVTFLGPLLQADLTTAVKDTAGVRFASTASLVTSQIVFDRCEFSGTVYGANTDAQVKGITISCSNFDTLYQGVVLGAGTPVLGGPTGFKMLSNTFDNIYAQGVYIGAVSLNSTGYNIFYDVGNHFNGTTNPATTVIDINADNNACLGDMFQRSDAYIGTYRNIQNNNKRVIWYNNGSFFGLGTYGIGSGARATLVNNTVSAATIFTWNTVSVSPAFKMAYTITRDIDDSTENAVNVRTGTLTVVGGTDSSGTNLNFDDTGVENVSPGVTFSVTETAGVISVKYTTTNTGINATLSYSTSRLV